MATEMRQIGIRGYLIEEEIGAGGFATVYRARQESVKREVAIKVVLPALANIPSFVNTFDNEARLVAQIEHPHIVPLYDYWREPSGAYLIMRLMAGGNLREYIQNKRLDVAEVLRVFDHISAALDYAHQHKIIHKDIKPENILIDKNRNFYLGDFGIAQELDVIPDEDSEIKNFFPLEYASPEQLELQPLSLQSDIYNLGLVLRELVSGQRPKDMYGRKSMNQLVIAKLGEKTPALDPSLPLAFLDDVIQKATALKPAERFKSVQEFRRAVKETVTYRSGQIPYMLDMDLSQAESNVPNPYKGLQSFEESDAAKFFGREQLLQQLLQRLQAPGEYEHFLAVVGASGSGKSSLVKAGLLPLLRSGVLDKTKTWFVSSMTPGRQPFEHLAAALLSISLVDCDVAAMLQSGESLNQIIAAILPDSSQQIWLLIDQFEEVFTLLEDENERQRFLDLIYETVVAADSRLRIIITLRADFYDRPLYYEKFSRLMQKRSETVTAFSEQEIREIIIAPLKNTGVLIEPELVTKMLADVQNQAGMLPLLQFALMDLFEQREGQWLRRADYEKNGGILGILSSRADEIFNALNSDEQALARQIILRLVTLGEGSRDTRRRVELSELQSLVADSEKLMAIIQSFGRARIFTLDYDAINHQPTVEVAHEALIQDWQRLRNWLIDFRSVLSLQRQVAGLSKNWQAAAKDWSFLVTGSQLEQYRNLQSSQIIQLTEAESAYIQASFGLDKARKRLRNAFYSFLALIALIMTGEAFYAIQQQEAALLARSHAESRALAMLALDEPLDRALLLALYAQSISDTYESRDSLLRLLLSEPNLNGYWQANEEFIRTIALDTTGQYLAAGDRGGQLFVWNRPTKTLMFQMDAAHSDAINSLSFSPDSRFLATGSEDGLIQIWELASGSSIQTISTNGQGVWAVTYSADGRLLYAGTADGVLHLWDSSTGELLQEIPAAHQGIIFTISLHGDLLATAGGDNLIKLWHIEGDGIDETPQILQGHSNWVLSLAFNAAGELASGSADGTIRLWNLATGETNATLQGHRGWVRSLSFSGDSLLLSAATDGFILAWNTRTGNAIGRINQQVNNPLWTLAVHDNLLFSAGEFGAIQEWNLDGRDNFATELLASPNDVRRIWLGEDAFYWIGTVAQNQAQSLFFSSPELTNLNTVEGEVFEQFLSTMLVDENWLLLGSSDGLLFIRDKASQTEREIRLGAGVYSLALSPDNRLLALGLNDGRIQIWQTASVLEDWSLSASLEGQQHDRITDLAFNFDGSVLASSSLDGSVALWQMSNHSSLGLVQAHPDGALSLAFHPTQNWLISSGVDETLLVYQIDNFQNPSRIQTEHNSWILDVEFRTAGDLFATASADKQIILWDSQVLQPLGLPLQAHDDWVVDIAFDSSGETLLSAGNDGRIIAWDLRLSAWQQRACQISARNLSAQEIRQYLRLETALTICSQ